MWLELQTGIGVPLSRQVYEQVKALILRGDLKAEEKLPSSRTLGKDLGIARHTVLEAYEQLLAEAIWKRATAPEPRCPRHSRRHAEAGNRRPPPGAKTAASPRY